MVLIFSDHIQQGSYQSLIKVGISTQAGHIVVQSKARPQEVKVGQVVKKLSQLEHKLTQASELAHKLGKTFAQKDIPAVVIARAEIAGLLNSPAGGARTRLLAIDPELEPQVSDWHKRLVPAALPQGEQGEAIESKWLDKDDHRGIILGQKLAERLDLTVGDKVVFSFNYQQENQSRLFRIRGVIKLASVDQEASTALINLKAYNERSE